MHVRVKKQTTTRQGEENKFLGFPASCCSVRQWQGDLATERRLTTRLLSVYVMAE